MKVLTSGKALPFTAKTMVDSTMRIHGQVLLNEREGRNDLQRECLLSVHKCEGEEEKKE